MVKRGLPRVKVGCCGFRGGMGEYFRQFKLVEVQQTFYKMPRLETAQRWRQTAPADFEFTLKTWHVLFNNLNRYQDALAFVCLIKGEELDC